MSTHMFVHMSIHMLSHMSTHVSAHVCLSLRIGVISITTAVEDEYYNYYNGYCIDYYNDHY